MTIDPLLPLWLIVVLLAGFLFYSIAVEWRRPLRFRIIRLLACAVATASLAIIFLRPAYPVASGNKTILLTKGYSRTVADSLRRAIRNAAFYHLDAPGYRGARSLNSYRELFNTSEQAHTPVSSTIGNLIAVVGEGLPAYALDSIRGGFNYLPSPVPDGISSISIPGQSVQRNARVTISGTYMTSHAPCKIYFSSPGGILDSLSESQRAGEFSFTFTPRVSGQVTYTLSIIDSLGTRIEEVVPIRVSAFVPLNILLLQDYPTFELQHLKTYLSDRGHRIAARAQLSRNIFRTEYANRAAISVTKLTVPLLNEFDLLIADPATIDQLSSSERSSLASCMQKGLGMLLVFNGTPSKLPARELLPTTFERSPADTIGVNLLGKRFTLPAAGVRAKDFDGTTLLSGRGKTLSGYSSVREGAAGFQLLGETFSILLAGDSAAYGALWSPLLDGVARRRSSMGTIRIANQFAAYIDEPLHVEITSLTTPELFDGSVQIPVSEDPIIDDLWHATVWPGKRGWQALQTKNDTLPYYAFGPEDWHAMRIAGQQRNNLMAGLRPTSNSGIVTLTPVSLLVCWIAFILSMGILWLAPKL